MELIVTEEEEIFVGSLLFSAVSLAELTDCVSTSEAHSL